jgi:ribonuclease HI
VHISSIQS